ncbi:MAG TPA: hypothetical protein PLA69_05610 [Flavobacterium sp.]|nr:hypothetical protein [Flavobacterium sp.]
MVYKFRVILDAEEDVFRDIAILHDDSLEDLHNAIVNAFGFDGSEPASFYTCGNQWNQDEEISLFDTGDVAGEQKIMSDYQLSELLDEQATKIIYVYDFINMWTFLVELAAIEEPKQGETYPAVLFAHGEMPESAPEKDFTEAENEFDFDQDDYDEEDLDMFDDNENFEDFGFEENWN